MSTKKSQRRKSDWRILRQPCRHYLKGIVRDHLVSSCILPSVNFYKTQRGVKPVISVCSRIRRLLNNQTKGQRKATIQTKEEKAKTRMLWLLWKLCHNWVAPRQTRKHWFLEEANSPGETRCKKSWDRLEKYGSLSLRYVKDVSRKRKDHRLEKDKSNLLISEVPTLWILRTGPMKRLKDSSDEPEARHGTLSKICTSSRRKTKLHSTRPRKNGFSRLR